MMWYGLIKVNFEHVVGKTKYCLFDIFWNYLATNNGKGC